MKAVVSEDGGMRNPMDGLSVLTMKKKQTKIKDRLITSLISIRHGNRKDSDAK